MDVYPWAAPTEEQKRMFDALDYDEQLAMIREALVAAENSGISDRTLKEIFESIKKKLDER